MEIPSGRELMLDALKRDHKRLTKLADKAKADCDVFMGIASELCTIRQEAIKVLNSGNIGDKGLKKLEDLSKREARGNKILKKDVIKLMDKQSEAEIKRDRLAEEIAYIEFRMDFENRTNGSVTNAN